MAKTRAKSKPVKVTTVKVKSPVAAMVRRVPIRARYDAAQTTNDNRRHWANADGLSADAANGPSVRNYLRQRARYECDNNTYARGMLETLANDTIGTGTRLQIRGLTTKEAAREIEAAFREWCYAVGLTEALRVMRKSKSCSGEVFAVKTYNPRLPTPVKLDLQIIEADQCASPHQALDQPVDGIELDPSNRPAVYQFLKDHPGAAFVTGFNETYRVPADLVIHYFRKDRPGQHRGIPEITPALPLFAQLRRYTLAVIAAAETAADFAGVLQSDASANTGDVVEADAFETVELEQRMLTVLPAGYQLGQIDAKQPTTTYGDFKKEILNEIARCLNMPYNIAACNSSGYNYSSGRLDHQTYYKSIDVERGHIEDAILTPIFRDWLREALITPDALTPAARAQLETVNNRPIVQWFWDGMKHVDPAKEATAEATRLTSNTTTLAAVYAEQGLDWEDELEQIGKERKRMAELGITPAAPARQTQTPANDPNANDGADPNEG